ncbi:DNA-binding storekeeper protein-related transcriptional regulator [Raphanus sativus]|nr:DNA-binding storekeeper protein-related transcriptional regulator [Raphanus sativus]
MNTQGEKIGSDHRRLFSEKDEIVLLQAIIDTKGKNPVQDNRPLYESMKGSFSSDITLRQFSEKIRNMRRKYTAKEMRGEQASASNPHQQKCFQLSKAIWGVDSEC